MTEQEKRWDEFFANGFYFEGWDFRIDPQQTQAEVDGILALLKPRSGIHLIDWCGGYGRHAVEFAKRGFQVTLLDKAPNHIEMARQAAEQAGVSIELVCADFRQTPALVQADFAVNLFTSGIGYLTEEDDVQALRSLYAALKPGALFLLDTMNLFWLARNYQPKGWEGDESGKKRLFDAREFDFWTNRNHSKTILWKEGQPERQMENDHRIYTPSELAAVLRRAGFEPVELRGGFDGQPFDFDNRRIIMISRRP